ncbi:hypothetical protein AC579_1240 [Pseudocercospora musae]|uniref:Altered inheritance of mitochondria protein 24, mitochondrial n=1 Tax=Pseudocercospora musae TaxID=113226 RepID=A0A139I5K1_9PEZI|nr:hypothetical protein AC579_1240 [Pseudocercospora musae]
MSYQQGYDQNYQQQYQQPQYGQPPAPPQYGQQQQQYPAPPNGSFLPGQSDHGTFTGGNYSIQHRDTNAVLNIELQEGGSVRSRSGAMIHMASTVQLSGKVKFSMKKLFTGGEMNESTYTGHGRVALAPTLFGDVITLHVDSSKQWNIGKDVFLACTQEVTKETKSQGVGKAMFSGEDLFIFRVGGQGLLWLTSFGAVDRLDLQAGEQHIVDNGHLVAWSCDYKIEKAGGGSMSSVKTGEGMVCRFTGPGVVYIQVRFSVVLEFAMSRSSADLLINSRPGIWTNSRTSLQASPRNSPVFRSLNSTF